MRIAFKKRSALITTQKTKAIDLNKQFILFFLNLENNFGHYTYSIKGL